MKKVFLIFFLLGFMCHLHAQVISAANMKVLRAKEDSLLDLSRKIATEEETADRLRADSLFTRTLVRALLVPHSFYFPFAGVQGIAKLYAPDSSFRIITWNLQIDEYYSRQRGAIQMRTPDGKLKLFPLRDVSEDTDNAADSVRTAGRWIGAVYYNMIETEFNNQKYYTLFGIDFHSVRSTKKWIEVLHFNQQGEPVFGGDFFKYSSDSLRNRLPYRVQLEYKKDARVLVNYVPELDMILVDHLVSETDEPDNPWTLIPDGDNQAFKWDNGKWVHIDKVFDYKIEMNATDPYMGNPPVGLPKDERPPPQGIPIPPASNNKKKTGGNQH